MAEDDDTPKPARGKVKLAVGFPVESHRYGGTDGEPLLITADGTDVPAADADDIIAAAELQGVTIRKVS